MNTQNPTKLYTLKWYILCYVCSIFQGKNTKMEEGCKAGQPTCDQTLEALVARGGEELKTHGGAADQPGGEGHLPEPSWPNLLGPLFWK